jgi:nitrite reductase/ring-hydroxylating ferredoxin subunit
MSAANRIDLCSTAEVTPGNVMRVEKAGLVLAVFNLDGEFFVTDDACTHGPGSLSEGFIEGEVVECNFHNGQFNIKTGEVVAPPCMVPIKVYKTILENGRVLIETE